MAKKKSNSQPKNMFNVNIDELHIPEIGFYGLAEKMSDEQREFAESILHNDITFCNAKAGTGKTTIAVAVAKFLMEYQLIDKLVYIISPCEQHTLGHLPGDADEKIAQYMGALNDALIEIGEFPMQAMDEAHGWVTATSQVFMRGINLKKSCIIIDETQNFTKADLKRVLTRISDDCFIVCIGHDLQCDLRKPETSGFLPMMHLFETLGKEKGLKVGNCKLTINYRGIVSQVADELDIN